LTDLLVGQRSVVLESTRVVMRVSTWLNTAAASRVEGLRGSSDRSLELLLEAAGQVAAYRAQGWQQGLRAALQDLLGAAGGLSSASGLVLDAGRNFLARPLAALRRAPGTGVMHPPAQQT